MKRTKKIKKAKAKAKEFKFDMCKIKMGMGKGDIQIGNLTLPNFFTLIGHPLTVFVFSFWLSQVRLSFVKGHFSFNF